MSKKSWYVLAVEPGADSKVRKGIVKAVRKEGMQKVVGRITIPRCAQTVYLPDGKEVRQNRMMFPGYLLVHCKYTDDVFHLIDGAEGAWGLLTVPEKPTALTSVEAALCLIRERVKKGSSSMVAVAQPTVSKFRPGQAVKVTQGPWIDFVGEVFKIKSTNPAVVLVNIRLFGKETTISVPETYLE